MLIRIQNDLADMVIVWPSTKFMWLKANFKGQKGWISYLWYLISWYFCCHTHALFFIWIHIWTHFRNRLPNGENAIFLEQTSLNLKSHADIDV